MDALLEWSWRGYPAALLVVIGASMVAVGLARDAAGMCRPVSDPHTAWAMVRCFRTVIIGLACIGIGAAWVFQLEALLGIALILGIGETIETTTVLAACREGSWPAHIRPARDDNQGGAA
jgi:hypothetical protein